MTVHIKNMTIAQIERFWAKVNKTETCWFWTGDVDHHGYGAPQMVGLLPLRRRTSPHRIAYQLLVGPIADGLVLDHLCKTPPCVNPAHLEPVTQAENLRRGNGNGMKELTHCKRGHEFTPENTRANGDPQRRQCVACKVAYDHARYAAGISRKAVTV